MKKKYKIWGQKGRVSEILNLYIESSLDTPYDIFTRQSINKILNNHVNTAYRKMGNGEVNLLKFIIEDGIITHVQTMQPRHTSPRLKTLNNFMRDLSLTDSTGRITREGISLLESITN